MRREPFTVPAAYIFYMEFLFSQIKKMEVICLNDGKNLGRIYDAEFTMPDGKIKGFYLTGCKGFKLTKSDVYVKFSDVVKIGEDVILVRQDEDEKLCPPPNQPPCPPPCPPTYQPPCPPPKGNNRRNYDDYE